MLMGGGSIWRVSMGDRRLGELAWRVASTRSPSQFLRFTRGVASLLRNATFRRWFDILVYGISGAAAFEVLLPIGIHFSKRVPVPDVYAPWLSNDRRN